MKCKAIKDFTYDGKSYKKDSIIDAKKRAVLVWASAGLVALPSKSNAGGQKAATKKKNQETKK